MGWAPRGGLRMQRARGKAAEARVARRDAAACRAKHDEYATLREDCSAGSAAAGSCSGRKRVGVQAVHSATCCARRVRRCSLAAGCTRLQTLRKRRRGRDERSGGYTAVNTTEKRYKRWAATPNFVWRPQIAGSAAERGNALTCDRRTLDTNTTEVWCSSATVGRVRGLASKPPATAASSCPSPPVDGLKRSPCTCATAL